MITILGAGGYIGSNIVQFLQTNNVAYYAPARNEVLDNKRDLGDIIYCIGLTADFRSKPFETVEAHVGKLAEVLKHCTFNSLTYLSSARVYINCNAAEVTEEAIIPVNPLDPSELYTLTKLTGERLCLSSGKKVKIVRLSNVYGNDNASDSFLADVLKKITAARSVSFSLLPASAKDYIHIEDVVRLLVKIAVDGKDTIYNLASGFNTSNEAIIENLSKHFSFSVDLSQAKKAVIFPLLNIEKIKKEFNYSPGNIITFIPHLIKSFYNVSN